MRRNAAAGATLRPGGRTEDTSMSYNDNRNRVGDETSYTGWIIGGIVALAVIVAIFAFSRNTGDTNSASNTPGTSTGTAPSTTGSGRDNSPAANSPATNTPAAPATAPAR